MIEISEVVKNFENVRALQGVSLQIEDGSFFGLLGPNGAGKTTLLNVIIGLLKPDAGHVAIDGEVLVYNDVNVKRKFGYVPQEIALYQELTALTNLKIFGRLYGVTGKKLNERIDWALEIVGLSERKNDVVKNFSGGMKRRLNIACSILHNPEIILCDEPTVGVDPQSRNAIFEMLKKLNREEGKLIIYTTHYMEEAERLCDKMAIIDYGKIIAEGTLEDLTALLEKKETVKILKNDLTVSKLEELKLMGMVNETEFYIELIPKEDFKKNVRLFEKFEELGIPDDNVEISRASLEDVFLFLTGRNLRD